MTILVTPHTSGRHTVTWLVAIAVVLASSHAWAQPANRSEWQRGTTLGGFAGISAADGRMPALGTALGWEIHPNLTVDGRGLWMTTDPGNDFYAALNALVTLRPLGNIVPFALAGVGMYRATVDAASGAVPEFYERRLNGRTRASFEDVALPLGGGANVFITPHLAIRPEVSVVLVRSGGTTRTVGLHGVHVAYHFAPHTTR